MAPSGANFGQRVGAVEAVGVGVDALGTHVVELAEATALFCLKSTSRQFGDVEIFVFFGGI